MTLGFFLWFPTPSEEDLADEKPRLKLHVEAEPKHRMFLDWNEAGFSAGYTLFVGDLEDGILERMKDYPASQKTDLIQVPYRRNKILFVIAPRNEKGFWVQKSNLFGAEFLQEDR
jgi:hypothetical protein